ncbi:hypothetical protein KY331_00895 [Candidatus Woesearchaeota archaeon]|nr:hypothetical protein [Candidatus Woesearchaeota archaeon]
MALNASLTNITAAEPGFFSSFLNYIQDYLWPRFIELVTAPYNHKNMIWIITPMIIVLVLMELYFGRYKQEELGWNTAVGNSIVLFFVSIDLFRYLYEHNIHLEFWQFIFENLKGLFVASIVGLSGIWMLLANFFHVLPKKLAFFISSSLPINVIAYVAIVTVYSEVPFDLITLNAGLILFIGLMLVFGLIHLIEPKYHYKQKVKPEVKEGKDESKPKEKA